jgi:hypothetical protein
MSFLISASAAEMSAADAGAEAVLVPALAGLLAGVLLAAGAPHDININDAAISIVIDKIIFFIYFSPQKIDA